MIQRSLLKLYLQTNWIKTIYLNFRVLPFLLALRMPILLFGHVNLRVSKGAKIAFSMGGWVNSHPL